MSAALSTPRNHTNWFDECRLLFASSVLVSHSFELIDGDRHRELFTTAFGTCSLGEVAVGGFLALSGYLVSAAWARAPSPGAYLRNRAVRIVPAYVVAFLISVFVVGAGSAASPANYLGALDWPKLAFEMVTLGQPQTPSTFPGLAYPLVNGALWTIQLEFFCYLLTPLAQLWRWSLVGLWVAAAAATVLTPSPYARGVLVFLSGAMYWRFGLRWRPALGLACLAVLPFLLKLPHWWGVGLATAGVYALLGLASMRAPFRVTADVSYGVYLYGWPVQNLLIFHGLRAPWTLFAASLAIAGALGAASWFGVERRALRLKRSPARARAIQADVSPPNRTLGLSPGVSDDASVVASAASSDGAARL
jgi:peptidoglycan/LPS O-acetylase OafA/YrhL